MADVTTRIICPQQVKCVSFVWLILSNVSHQDKGTFLLVLDAKTFEELGRADVPVNIPYGFHGTFATSS